MSARWIHCLDYRCRSWSVEYAISLADECLLIWTGIGEHIAKAYVQAKASNIIITARTASSLENVKEQLEALAAKDGRVVHVTCCPSDATRPETYAKLRRVIDDTYNGRLDCLICNAGGLSFKSGWTKDISLLDLEEFNQGTALNYQSAVYAAKHLMPCLLHPQAVGRTIVNVTSGASNLTRAGLAPPQYSISKLALNRITQMLAENYEAEGLVAVALNPGGALTPGTEAQLDVEFQKRKFGNVLLSK